MAVPGHDARDYEFAKKFNLTIKQVVTNKEKNINLDNEAYCDKAGIAINSSNSEVSINELDTPLAIEKIND
jgi:leucyl-tRNA synthetase